MKRNFVVLTPTGSVESCGANALSALAAASLECRRAQVLGIIDTRCVVEPKIRTPKAYEAVAGYKSTREGGAS